MSNKEEHIIHLLKKGDNEAYKYLFNYHYPLLCIIAYGYLKDESLARDVVDDLIFNLWEKRETFEIKISLRSYLVKAVRNRCLNFLQLERERKEIPFSSIEDIEKNITHYSSFENYPLGILLEKELEKTVMEAISNLPEESRTVFKMSRFEEKRYDQIAEELGITVNTVKYHMKRALNQLKTELGKYLFPLFICWVSFL